ncbi:MAG: sensor histidine kinase N-terminal domain-containing protein [Pseudomonadota bacterium]
MAETSAPQATLSLKSRVALAVAAVLALGAVVVLLAALAYGRKAAQEAYDRLLIGAATDIAASIAIRDGAPVVDIPMSAFELLGLAPEDRIRYRVVGADGVTLTGDADVPLPSSGDDLTLYDGSFGDEPARYAALVRRFAERSYAGPVTVVIGQTLRARRELARDIAQNAVIALGVAGAVMAGFAWAVVGRAMRPLPRIGAALRGRDPTDLTPLDIAAPLEVAGMLEALNGFMARLDRQVAANRNVIGDAAHQLRTPAAAIRAQVQRAAVETDPDRRAALLTRAETQAGELGRLLDQMLSRAMIIHRADTEPHAVLDLRDVAIDVYEACDDAVIQSGVAVDLLLPDDPVPVQGDALSLAEAGKNLLMNALHHGAPPIRLGVEGGKPARLWVSDAGPGLPEDFRAEAGTRFARAGASGSTGLGLAIAQEVATAHGGTMTFGRRGWRFEVALELPGPRD